MRNPITLRCLDRHHGVEVYQDLLRRGAPAGVGDFPDGCRVTMPGDSPRFVFAVVETALAEGHITDDDGAACIRDLEAALNDAAEALP